MTRIFVVRHGETDGNLEKICRGHWDLPLNKNGKAQVQKTGEATWMPSTPAHCSAPCRPPRL